MVIGLPVVLRDRTLCFQEVRGGSWGLGNLNKSHTRKALVGRRKNIVNKGTEERFNQAPLPFRICGKKSSQRVILIRKLPIPVPMLKKETSYS